MAHPSLLQNHLVSGRHRAPERNLSAKTSAVAVHDEAGVETTSTPKPQEEPSLVQWLVTLPTTPKEPPGTWETQSTNEKSKC